MSWAKELECARKAVRLGCKLAQRVADSLQVEAAAKSDQSPVTGKASGCRNYRFCFLH